MMVASIAKFDVLVAGEYFCDLIFTGLPEAPRLGAEFFAQGLAVTPGGSYNMVLALSRLGLKTVWSCDFGSDMFSRLVLEQAERDGLDSRLFNHTGSSLRRVSSSFSLREERGFVSFNDADIRAPSPALFKTVAPQWLLQTFRYDPDWLSFMRAAKASGACIFSDCRFPEFTLATPGVAEFLALTDIFSPNEDEAMGMTGKADPETALTALSEICPMVVMKRGRGGATVLDHGNRLDVPAPSVEVVDVTGAGDAFNAGFLFGMINDFSLEDSVRLAVLCGSKSTTAPGSRATPGVTALKDFATANGLAALWSRRKHPSGSVDLELQISTAIPNHGGNSA